MSSPSEDDNDFFNPSLLNDDLGQGSFDDLDNRLAKKLSVNEYDDDKNDETFGDEGDDGGFFISNNDASDLVRGSRPYYSVDDDWNGKKAFSSHTTSSLPQHSQQHHYQHSQQQHSLFGSTSSPGGSAAGFHNAHSSLNTSGSSTGSGFGIPIGHSPSSPSNYIPGGTPSHHHTNTGSFGSFGSNNSGSFGSFTHQPVISSPRATNILLGSPSATSPSGSFLSNILGASPNSGATQSSIIGGGQHIRQGSNNGSASLWGTANDNQNDDAFLGSFFAGSGSGSSGGVSTVGTHHHTTSGSSTKQSTGLHYITDLISEEDEDDKSSGSGRSSTHQLSSGANSPFGFTNTEVSATIAANSRIPISGGLEPLEFLPTTVAHKHPELVKGEKQQAPTTTSTTNNTTSGGTTTNQQTSTPSYLMVKYNTYNTEDKTDCYNVINKVVVNEVLNKIPTPQDQRNKFHRFNNNNRSHNNNNNNNEKPHRIIQFMRIDEVETIIRQQMVDLQVHNGYSDDYYYFVKNNNTEQTIDLLSKHLTEEEEERENARQTATSNQQQGTNNTSTTTTTTTTPPARLFGRIPSQNVRTPRTCFDTNVFRDEVVDQYYKHKRIPSELRTRLVYNNPIQLRTCIENGLTLLIEIEEFQTVAQHSKEISPKVAESSYVNCQTVASYLLYHQEIWNIPKGKKFICKCLNILPQPFNTKLLLDMIPILIAEHSTNPQLVESMIKSLNSIVNIGTITLVLVQLMRSPPSSIEFLNALLNRAITILSPKYQQQQMVQLNMWYQTLIQQFIPFFMSYYHTLTPDILYPILSNILKLIPRNLPQFHHILFHIAHDPHNHPLKAQLIQLYTQPTYQ
ncbi:predicted protein [Naegleria gruberi]|uniref:Predicted protein n=1 Tax=Naegleria gruberi TaxID=5762 RepID=D2V8D3_NAEGR|nr:uncharacterized protein NAEGRDRAFT_65116 [Naegleria gruberi]EFC47158.1 predicted protein [Naegleria gruberi]|eukprot:XP_002679902.1 predicted protein [Naegleria gruberi strain NEG-M]